MKSSTARLGDLVQRVSKWDPRKSPDHQAFPYIDLSSVDKGMKAIVPLNVPLVEPADAPSRARQLVQEGDVLVSTVRPNLNGVALVDSEFDGATASTGYCVLRPDPERLDSNYLFYWVQAPGFIEKMVREATGANYPAVSDRIIKASELPLPALAEQKRIATILNKADTLRRKRRQAIELADQFLRSVFLDMFGDPQENPHEWSILTLGDLVEFAKDGPHVSPAYSEEGIPFLSTRHVKPLGVVWDDLKYLSREEATFQWKKCKPQFGDVLYTKGGTTGIACPVDFDEEFAVWVHVALLRPIPEKVNFIWLSHMLNTSFCYRQSQKYTRGATNKDLGLKRMVQIQFPCPPMHEQERFVKIKKKVDGLVGKYHCSEYGDLSKSLGAHFFD